MRWYEQSEQAYRGVRRIGYTRDLWSAPAKRSDDGALTVPEHRAERSKAGSRFACPRSPKVPAPQLNVARPTVPTEQSGGKRDSKVLALSNGGCSPQCVKRFEIGLGLDKRGGFCVHRPDRPPARPRPRRQATQSMTRTRTTTRRRRKRRAWRWSRHSSFGFEKYILFNSNGRSADS